MVAPRQLYTADAALRAKEVASFHRQNKILRAGHFAWSGVCADRGGGSNGV